MNNSKLYQLTGLMKEYVVNLMRHEGRNFHECEQCYRPIPDGKHELHHTKYVGATYYDIEIVCRSCNRIDKNIGLA